MLRIPTSVGYTMLTPHPAQAANWELQKSEQSPSDLGAYGLRSACAFSHTGLSSHAKNHRPKGHSCLREPRLIFATAFLNPTPRCSSKGLIPTLF